MKKKYCAPYTKLEDDFIQDSLLAGSLGDGATPNSENLNDRPYADGTEGNLGRSSDWDSFNSVWDE